MTSGVTRSSPANGNGADPDVGVYVALEDLIAEAHESGCECNVCEELRAANITAHANQRPLQARYRRLTVLLNVAVALIVILVAFEVADIFLNLT